MDASSVLVALDEFCRSQEPGAIIPTHTELMRRYQASERAVRWALNELVRQGKILRRQGVPTSVASIPKAQPENTLSYGGSTSLDDGLNQLVIAIGEPDGGFFDQAMSLLVKQAKRAKLSVQCRLMQADELEKFRIPDLNASPHGFVVFRRHFLPFAEKLHAAGHRVVFVGTPTTDVEVNLPYVAGDQEHGGYLAVKHLIDLGHRRIVFHFIGDYTALRRWIGCQRALNEAQEEGIEVESEILDHSDACQWKVDSAQVKTYFARSDAPTGIVSWNDDSAIELLTILLRNGIRVPEDVSLVGYDNLKRSGNVHPALTTVDGALDSQIQAALRLLSQPQPVSNVPSVIVLPNLIQRDSSSQAENQN